MGAKDRDIAKLKDYAKELGLTVYTKKYTRYTGQAEYVDGISITLFVTKRTTKTEMILSLLHELGHHLDWSKNKKPDPVLDKSLELLSNGAIVGKRKDISKKYRKKILQIEKSGIKYMSKIHDALGLEIPLEIVKQQEQLDVFTYVYLYEKARFATKKELETFCRQLNHKQRKYGKGN